MDEKSTWMLAEREKELECMYAVDDILQDKKIPLPVAMGKIVQILPSGFSQPDICRVEINLYGVQFAPPDFSLAVYLHRVPIQIDEQTVGSLEVRYIVKDDAKMPSLLSTEIKIINAVSARISQLALKSQREINIVLDMLQKTNPDILARISQRLQVYVSNLEGHSIIAQPAIPSYGEVNTPMPKTVVPDSLEYCHKLVSRASVFLSCSEINEMINQWIQDERLFSLVKTVGNRDAQVSEIFDAVQNFTKQSTPSKNQSPTEKWLIAELSHRFLTNDENLIDRVIGNLAIKDFQPIISKIIGSSRSGGSIGGKGAGLFIAEQILKHVAKSEPLLENIKTPRTWYLAADQIDEFLRYNHMEEMNSYKYNPISYIRMTYDDIVIKIKNARLPSHILQMLSLLLDDLNDTPIIVRSSSLLEDRSNSAFSGKYKSLYLSNQGTKQERLEALTDAILEVYSSQYNPDSIEYRTKRRLLHFSEKMGILIQEVVGTKVGPYYLPLFAGVAFSENPLCWSPRITRDGGLVRLVMGLGTRAVDRVSDYPLLFSPKNPGFRINQNPKDIKHYSQKYIDLINLETNKFETVEIESFLKEYGNQFPQLHKIVSVYQPELMQKKNFMDLSPKQDHMVVTFDGIISDTDFSAKILKMLTVLKEKMGVQVDLEFACDEKNLYLLQCRSLNKGSNKEAAPIPKHLPQQDILFTANKFISNGRIENIRYIVYVDGNGYKNLKSKSDMLSVGNAVGMLNSHLPRRKYILMGPGRWGSRGDIQLGVRVTYADISNTALLIEIARQQQSYVPELSFGTHFFQDLVESNISYLPLYPDDKDIVFKEGFFKNQPNHLSEFLPHYKELSDVIYVIDLSEYSVNKSLSVYMNADLNQAVAFINENNNADSLSSSQSSGFETKPPWHQGGSDEHWRWRKYMAEQITKELDFSNYGVQGVYLFGSTDEETAGISSDIDLILHFNGDQNQRDQLLIWLDGWSRALAKINYLRTGSLVENGLLDIHLVSDEDIANKESYALKIHSVIDPATPLWEEIQ